MNASQRRVARRRLPKIGQLVFFPMDGRMIQGEVARHHPTKFTILSVKRAGGRPVWRKLSEVQI